MNVDDIVEGMRGYLDSNGEVNYIMMSEGTSIIQKISSGIVGFFVMVIIIGLPVVIAIEVAYINFPIFQEGYERIYNRLKGRASKIVGLVIRDARQAVAEANTIETGQSANWIYLRKKVKAVFLAVFLVAMVLGPGEFVIAFAFKTARNFILAISNVIFR